MRRFSVAALGVLLATTAFLAPRATAGEPEPDPRAESTASYAEIGWDDEFVETFEVFLEGLGEDPDLSDERWFHFTPDPNPTVDPGLIERFGNPWIPERRTQFRASVTWDPDPDLPPFLPSEVLLEIAHTTDLRDSRFSQQRARLLHPADDTVEVEVWADEAGAVIVTHASPRHPLLAIGLIKAGPNAFTRADCAPIVDEVDAFDLVACADVSASWPHDSYEDAWPALSNHWPDPERQLTLPTHATLKSTRLTPGEMRVAAGFRGTPTTARRASDHPWNYSTRYLRGGRTATDVTLTRMGDVAAARTELAHTFDNLPAGTDVVRKADNVFTTYRSSTGVATTYQRTATGIVTADCHRWAAGTKAATIRCSVDVADAQADKTRPVLRP